MLRADRETLELQRGEAAVDVVGQRIRHARQQTFAERGVGRVQAACVTLGGVVHEMSVRADDAAVRAFPVEEWITRQGHDGVLIRMREFRVRRIAVLGEIAPRRSRIGREEDGAAVGNAAELTVLKEPSR